MRTRAPFVPLLLLAAPLLAKDSPGAAPKGNDDPIAAQLLKDKEAYVAALDKAKGDMLKGFDRLYEAIKKNKAAKIESQLAQLEKLEAEKKAFEESGVMPVSPGMKVAISEYRTAQKRAESACKAAFEKAARAYRDKGEVKLAGETLEEMKEFLSKAPTAAGNGGTAAAIVCHVSGKVLGLQNGAVAEGTKVVTADYAKGDQTQLWKVVPAADGWVYVENVKSGLVMTAHGRGNGTEVTIAKKETPASDDQLWKLIPVANVKDAQKVFAKPSGKLIGVDAKSKNAGARILLWTDQNESAQWFGFFTPK
jgi:hypothetical protein